MVLPLTNIETLRQYKNQTKTTTALYRFIALLQLKNKACRSKFHYKNFELYNLYIISI